MEATCEVDSITLLSFGCRAEVLCHSVGSRFHRFRLVVKIELRHAVKPEFGFRSRQGVVKRLRALRNGGSFGMDDQDRLRDSG